ncbi:MAG: MBL fold metallo-hydrolase [Gemmatimonadetes bacterium]|nr:MBL fold metallo-hydrolase [Gemmatimonadota bacterium]
MTPHPTDPRISGVHRAFDRRAFLAAVTAVAAGALVPEGLAAALPQHARAAVQGSRRRIADRAGLEALVLGTAQDAGFPQVGCYTPRCERGRAEHREGRGRYVSSLALVDPEAERFYLVDATPDITRQIDAIEAPAFRRRAGERRPFDGIFLTHAHIGHYTGLALLGNEGLGIRDTPVYCTAAMADFLSSEQPWAFLVEQGRIVPTPLETGRWHSIDGVFDVQLWPVPHRDEFADTVGFLFRGPSASLLFLPDIDSWAAWERDLGEVVRSVDVALLDGSFWSIDELPGRSMDDLPHPLMRSTMDRLQAVVDSGEAGRVVFTHLNNSNPALDEGGPEQAEVARRGFEIAREGMRFSL